MVRRASIGLTHALASAAMPFVFPAVAIGDELHCDGGLRQMVPLAPALHLGADTLVAVSTRFPRGVAPAEGRLAREHAGSPAFLLGKAIDALLLDHLDEDLGRLEQVNALLRAGRRCFGRGFQAAIDEALAAEGMPPARPVASHVIRPSRDLGAFAAEYVRGAGFARRRGAAAFALLRLVDAEGGREADLASYLLFDGGFVAELIDLGIADARKHHDALCALFSAGRRARRRVAVSAHRRPP